MEELKLVKKYPYDFLRETIPVWRTLIMKTGLESNDVLNANSYWRTDASLISADGTLLNGRQREDPLVLFDLSINKFVGTETVNDKTCSTLEAKITFDFYGENAYYLMAQVYAYLFQEDQLLLFKENKIGINTEIQTTNTYETIHNVQWLRGNMEITFTYSYETEYTYNYIDKANVNITSKKGNEDE